MGAFHYICDVDYIIRLQNYKVISITNKYFKKFPLYVWGILFYALLTLLSQDLPFFWDNVFLVSKIAHFYYEANFSSLILPNAIDSGHPPFFPYYMAVVWKIFGKSLVVSHWAVFPFLAIMVWAYCQLVQRFLPKKYQPFALLLLLIEPTLLGQSVLMGFDVALVAVYLVALEAIFSKKRWLLSLCLLILAAISLRGIIMVVLLGATEFTLCLYDFGWVRKGSKLIDGVKNLFFRTLAYFPMLICLTAWLVYHHQQTGFTFFNADAPWAVDYGFVDVKGFIWNTTIVGWRILDLGKITLWLVAFLTLWSLWKKYRKQGISGEQKWLSLDNPKLHHTLQLVIVFVVPVLCYLPLITLRYTPIMHRYLLVFFLLFGLFVLSLLALANWKGVKLQVAKWGIVLSLLSGHFWIYPPPIANGWDAHLGYLPYFSLLDDMHDYISDKNIPLKNIGTEFPAVAAQKFTHLTNTPAQQQMTDKDKGKLADFEYVLYSNLMNDFSLEQIQNLHQKRKCLKRLKSGNVFLELWH